MPAPPRPAPPRGPHHLPGRPAGKASDPHTSTVAVRWRTSGAPWPLPLASTATLPAAQCQKMLSQ
jgi:hypothetical protein